MIRAISALTAFAVGALYAGGFLQGLGFPVVGLALAVLGSGGLGVVYASLIHMIKDANAHRPDGWD